jgi:uncharacterized protein YbjT (DUF2867 family)
VKVVLFGATGMVGQGVLRACLAAEDVEEIVSIGRSKTGKTDAKLREIAHADFTDFSPLASDLGGKDACFFCMGVSSAGMSEADYTRVTYDYAMAAAKVLSAKSPKMTFVYVSGAGTDASEKGRSMWARVKGKTENAIAKLPFAHAYMFRPGFIQPMHGIVSKTTLYRVIYAISAPLYPLWKALLPGFVTTTDAVANAMLRVAREGSDKPVLETRDINRIGA